MHWPVPDQRNSCNLTHDFGNPRVPGFDSSSLGDGLLLCHYTANQAETIVISRPPRFFPRLTSPFEHSFPISALLFFRTSHAPSLIPDEPTCSPDERQPTAEARTM